MKRMSDKMCAERMLQARAHGGYKFPQFLRVNAKNYTKFLFGFGAAASVLAYLRIWPGVYILVGMAYGVFVRDVSWLKGVKQTWPFSVKVTDWDKVQKLADEKPLD